MTADAFIISLARNGGKLTTKPGGKLALRGPSELVTPEVHEQLKRHKPEILKRMAALERIHPAATLADLSNDPALGPSFWASLASVVLSRIDDAGRRTELRERFEERAGICEHDGNLSRDDAERLAYLEISNATKASNL